jgi:DNA-binding response OmpR family regulator
MQDLGKILIIEDEKLILEALQLKFNEFGYEVVLAYDGKEGLEKALSEHPDIILLDIILLVMDGLTFLRELRKDPWGANVPVLILSNLSDANTIEESKNKGAFDYLVKTDWRLNEVVDRVKKTLLK